MSLPRRRSVLAGGAALGLSAVLLPGASAHASAQPPVEPSGDDPAPDPDPAEEEDDEDEGDDVAVDAAFVASAANLTFSPSRWAVANADDLLIRGQQSPSLFLGRVSRTSLEELDRQALVSADNAFGLIVEDGFAYTAENTNPATIVRFPLAAGALGAVESVATLAASVPAQDLFPRSLLRAGDHAFLTENGSTLSKVAWADLGGTRTTVDLGFFGATELFRAGDFLYAARSDFSLRGRIAKVDPKLGSADAPVVVGDVLDLGAAVDTQLVETAVTDGTYGYFMTVGSSSSPAQIVKVDLNVGSSSAGPTLASVTRLGDDEFSITSGLGALALVEDTLFAALGKLAPSALVRVRARSGSAAAPQRLDAIPLTGFGAMVSLTASSDPTNAAPALFAVCVNPQRVLRFALTV
jgi:hypothetical protein